MDGQLVTDVYVKFNYMYNQLCIGKALGNWKTRTRTTFVYICLKFVVQQSWPRNFKTKAFNRFL